MEDLDICKLPTFKNHTYQLRVRASVSVRASVNNPV